GGVAVVRLFWWWLNDGGGEGVFGVGLCRGGCGGYMVEVKVFSEWGCAAVAVVVAWWSDRRGDSVVIGGAGCHGVTVRVAGHHRRWWWWVE
nr:hypothetical protein [Tanacetum cinerariifolium]